MPEVVNQVASGRRQRRHQSKWPYAATASRRARVASAPRAPRTGWDGTDGRVREWGSDTGRHFVINEVAAAPPVVTVRTAARGSPRLHPHGAPAGRGGQRRRVSRAERWRRATTFRRVRGDLHPADLG